MIKKIFKTGYPLRCVKAWICAIAIFISVFSTPCFVTANAAEDSEQSKIIVSLGDSYSSGEGIDPFYGTDKKLPEKVKDPDWLAHRSQNSWPGMLMLPAVDGKMAENRNTNWFFVAASGATTKDIEGRQAKPYRKEILGHPPIVYSDSPTLDPQISIFDQLNTEGKKVDYVTMTIGGNDADFAGVIKEAAVPFLNPGNLADKINYTWTEFFKENGIRDNILNVYKAIEKKTNGQAQIIIAGYPKLIDENKCFFFSEDEAKTINDATSSFNKAIKNLVNSCSGAGMKICFVSVEEAFEGHGAYADDPYINGIELPSKPEDIEDGIMSSYSIHPNYKGACAYAECVQAKINELEDAEIKTDKDDAVTYSTDLTVSAYGYDGNLYNDYKIIVKGTKNVALWGLFKSDYYEEITVTSSSPVNLSLPKGTYTITVTDGNSLYSQNLKARKNSKNKELTFSTIFGYETPEDTTGGQYDESNVADGAVMFNGHWYKVIQNDYINTWEDAQSYCSSQSGYLATITTKEENEFLYSYIKSLGIESAYFGLAQNGTNGTWRWITDEKVSYTNWNPGEPNGQNSLENYGMFYYKYSGGTWNDGDFGNSTDKGGTVFICEWGEYTPESAEKEIASQPKRETSDERDIVLVLDVSGSMSGTPMAETKKASTNFISTILKEDASIGIVTYDDTANMVSDFSVNETQLIEIANGINSGGGTNIEAGLQMAQGMLSTSNAEKKIIVLMSDGVPNQGKIGDELIAYADSIKDEGVYIYTLGFFTGIGGDKSEAYELMGKIASEGCHYEVTNADDLVFFFGDIADQINGQKFIYVRIACPVDVTVTYLGESLSSSEKDFNDRTSFGALSLEDIEGSDDKVKTLRLKEGKDYAINIKGTGRGKMDYTIGYMDSSGEYSDMRKFRNIDITRSTVIDTSTKYSDKTILNVDEDGDGKYDLKFSAGENEYGELVDYSYIIYIALIAVGVIAVTVVAVVIVKKSKKRKAA